VSLRKAPPALLMALAVALAACAAEPADTPDVTPDVTPAVTPEVTPETTPEDTPAATPDDDDETDADPTARVETAADVGDYLVDDEGFTLYIFLSDMPGMSHCIGQCAETWPPLTVADEDELAAGDGVTAELGTITRDDGSLQVTLDEWPLYYYAADSEAGDINGEGVGDVWFVARPDGSLPGESGANDYGY
jgi:predicted lipoprotein with Yx(FWY)xxD motif